MNRKKFGKLVTALRREHLEDQRPLSRPKFARRSGVDEQILANIEIGRKAILDADLLLKMADALLLNNGERKEFFLAAAGIEEQQLYQRRDNPKLALDEMLERMGKLQLPAFLVDQYFDIIAVNQMVLEIYNVNVNDFLNPDSDAVTRLNLMRFLFSPEFNEQKIMLGKHQEKFLANTMMLFRASSLRYRATEYFQRLQTHLKKFGDFRKFIQRKTEDQYYIDNNMHILLDNKNFGMIEAISASVVAATTAGDLKMFVFTPMSEDTARIFTKVARQGNYVFHALSDWPNKDILNGE